MVKVNNWQLKREMDYPHEESRPERQVAYIFDTNKCIECQTCTVACKTTWTSGKGQEAMFWNNVETKPFGSYPRSWDSKALVQIGKQKWKNEKYEGLTVFEAADRDEIGERVKGYRPKDEDYTFPNLGEDEISEPLEKGAFFDQDHAKWMFYLARICNHCTYPACATACPRKAIYKREQDGVVLIDQSRCRGYKECVKACPYKKTFYNMVTRTSEKCIGCYPLLEKGEQPRCVQTCIGKIRMQGWLSRPGEEREDNPLDYIVRIRKVALPLYPQLGLEPNVYYIPPIHVPRDFKIQMFGPGVDDALKAYKQVKEDRKLLGAFLLFGNTPKIITRFATTHTEAIGFNDKDEEVVRVPFTEKFFKREFFDKKREVFRHNTM